VLGFGARALRDADADDGAGAGAASGGGAASPGPPKYLNTSDNEIYHKGRHLYGANLARAHAAREGEVIVCEGYTDTIALHQAGIRNAVGLMGTALTLDQMGELARMAHTVLLALDADSSGQEAMLRASVVAAERKLELRVVEMPAGADPAELLAREGADAGAEAMRALVAQSVPFVRFRVERVLATGDHSSPEGRDRMLEQLASVFATLAPSAMRMELTRIVSERLSLPASLVERALSGDASSWSRRASGAQGAGRADDRRGRSAARGEAGRVSAGSSTFAQRGAAGRDDPSGSGGATSALAARGTSTERAFLALCIASPGAGAQALAELDFSQHFSDGRLRRVAEHLRGHLDAPASGLPEDDPELRALVAELVVEAGRESERPDMLEVQRLQLELARMDRQINSIRSGRSGQVSELARRRNEVKLEFDRAYARVLEKSG